LKRNRKTAHGVFADFDGFTARAELVVLQTTLTIVDPLVECNYDYHHKYSRTGRDQRLWGLQPSY
jgi:hypothetical protein